MRGVEDHRVPELAHDHDGAHIHHEVVVPEGGAPLGEEYLRITGGFDLAGDGSHILRGYEGAFLNIDGLSRTARRKGQIGLAAEKGRNLEDIHCGSGRNRLGGTVHVGEHRHLHLVPHALQNTQALLNPGPGKGLDAKPVFFGVGGLEDEGHVQAFGHCLDGLSRLHHERLGLDHAGTGDQG